MGVVDFKPRPHREFESGSIVASVWRTGFDDGTAFYKVTIRSLWNDGGKPKRSSFIAPEQLESLATAVNTAFDWIAEQPDAISRGVSQPAAAG